MPNKCICGHKHCCHLASSDRKVERIVEPNRLGSAVIFDRTTCACGAWLGDNIVEIVLPTD